MDHLNWRTSTFSDGLQCVEVAPDGDGVLMRDSKDQHGPKLCFGTDAFGAFVRGVKAGEFDSLA